jgi:cell wall-associated NlpC family hydrolase
MDRSPALRGFFSPFVWALATALTAAGCSGSSPRFRDGSGRTSKPTPAAKDGARFASREAEEERREDDKRVPKEEIEKVTSGTRSFKTEKNIAIAPLDHSKMMREISRRMGIPYRLGGTTEEGLDCSGYTMLVYQKSIGKQLPRTSADQSAIGSSVELNDLKFGDLVFFNTTGESASHVGIYIGDDLFAHASVSLGVTISSLQSSYYQKRYEGARRIVAP